MTILEKLQHARRSKIAVLGLGKSGIAALRYLSAQGFAVLAIDEKLTTPSPELQSILTDYPHIECILGSQFDTFFSRTDLAELVVLSPGVSPSIIPDRFFVSNEAEIAVLLSGVKPIIVTGSAGKSTTATLLHHILQHAQQSTLLAGNIGTPVIECMEALSRTSLPVLELSSYQLEQAQEFLAQGSVFTGLSANHLERHGTIERYFAAKASIFKRLEPGCFAVLNASCPYGDRLRRKLPAFVHRMGFGDATHAAAYDDFASLTEQGILFSNGELLKTTHFRLPGAHNLANLMAAALAARRCGVSIAVMQRSLLSFVGLAHRLEPVPTNSSHHFYNDSKATTPQAVVVALRAVALKAGSRVWLLLGGAHKLGLTWEVVQTELQRLRSEGVSVELSFFGASAGIVARELGATQPSLHDKLGAALISLSEHLRPGDTVLLSPGCPSFDEFGNFEERGNVFKSLVQQLYKGSNVENVDQSRE
jgi:UDP-N-acetylmuramoylalanine--D-glutamate ligase